MYRGCDETLPAGAYIAEIVIVPVCIGVVTVAENWLGRTVDVIVPVCIGVVTCLFVEA